jgi:hypothetical protein
VNEAKSGMNEEEGKKSEKSVPKRPEVRFYVTARVWRYLELLSSYSILGDGPNDVAEHVLLQRLSEMRQEDFKADKL